MTITFKVDLTQSIHYNEEGSTGLYRKCEKWTAHITPGAREDRLIQPDMRLPPGFAIADTPREAINLAMNDLAVMGEPV